MYICFYTSSCILLDTRSTASYTVFVYVYVVLHTPSVHVVHMFHDLPHARPPASSPLLSSPLLLSPCPLFTPLPGQIFRSLSRKLSQGTRGKYERARNVLGLYVKGDGGVAQCHHSGTAHRPVPVAHLFLGCLPLGGYDKRCCQNDQGEKRERNKDRQTEGMREEKGVWLAHTGTI